jgi:hypothetical protein
MRGWDGNSRAFNAPGAHVLTPLTEVTLITPFVAYLVLTVLTPLTVITVVALTCEHREWCEDPCDVRATSSAIRPGLL